MKNKFLQKLCLTAVILVVVFSSIFPPKAHAIPVVVTADVSPTSLMNTVNHTMQRLKSFVLDKLATLVAKQILHQLTVQVVNWINNGFEGSPAFLTNPAAFFMDVGDQVTGAFLATNGPLSSLCEPFSIDVRLSLALNHVELPNARYECTLSRIIEAQKNGPEIIVNGQVVRSGSSMRGFTSGDFSQGGWPAFVEMTTKPQNNPFGSVLTAHSDLQTRLLNRQNKIQFDLQLGSGFMSWESCKDVPGGSKIDLNTEEGISKSGSLQNTPGSKQVSNPDGTVTYQKCETQTPGSVIAGTLQTNLNVPVVELELANDINAVVNALVTAMVNKMLTSGLHALSGDSGTGQAYTSSIIEESNNTYVAQTTAETLQPEVSAAISQISSIKLKYDQAVNYIETSKIRYIQAEAFCTNKNTQNYGIDIAEFHRTTVGVIDPLLNSLKKKQASSTADLKILEDIQFAIAGSGSAETIQAQADKYVQFLQSGGMSWTKENMASEDLENARVRSVQFNQDSDRLKSACMQIR